LLCLTLIASGTAVAHAGGAAGRGHDATMARLYALASAEARNAAPTATTDEVAVPRARCGSGSKPEPGLQGEVTDKDRASGRSTKEYTCNVQRLSAPLGEGAGLQAAYYKHCAYYGMIGQGTRVVDVRDPRKPKITTTLTSPAMLDPWESLKVHEGRGLLAAVEGSGNGVLFFDVYDIKTDCTKPVLKASMPVNTIGHEGEWALDGLTYYATALSPGLLTAIDVADPAAPKIITVVPYTGLAYGHGLSTNKDGSRIYAVDPDAFNALGRGQGLRILDATDIKKRVPGAQPKVVGSLYWLDGGGAQHTIPVTYHGKQHVIYVDELGYGAARILDVSHERQPRIVSYLRTEIQLSQNRAKADAQEGASPSFAYNDHYCNVDRLADPTVLGCSSRASGLRIFDIRDPLRPKEIAYYNAGGTSAGNSGSMTAQVHFVPERGEVWSTDGGKGFFVLKFTNGAWPFRSAKG
jgi:hypothetical protein